MRYLITSKMNTKNQTLTDKFLRSFTGYFTVHDMGKFFSEIGVKATKRDCMQYLEECPWVFCLENGKYITKAGAFTGEIFSIRLTPEEYEKKIFIPGSRCIPFVDSEIISGTLSFYFYGKLLPRKIETFTADKAIDFFLLYGEEYAPQYIASDPANSDIDMVERDFELPGSVHLTGIDISLLIDKYGFKLGDRLVCAVQDWDKGRIYVKIIHDGENHFNRGFQGSARLEWYDTLERLLLESFDRMGPCGSMEEQLSNVFFENIESLCIPTCGSIEEYLNQYAKNVGLEHFGVETRLWFKGKEVPAVGPWNCGDLDAIDAEVKSNPSFVSFTLTPELIDQYLLDMHYRRENDYKELLEKIYPEDYLFQSDQKFYILEMLKERDRLISKEYNWFADQGVGEVRRLSLELFTRVNALVYKIDCSTSAIQELPQQELVILTQLYGHLYRILHSIQESESLEKDASALLLSIDGMKWNFEDIREPLEAAVEKQRCNRFKVIKAP